MANHEHVKILKQGVKIWNKWRWQHQEIRPNLSKSYLSDFKLSGANLWGVNLSEANLRGADLSRADLRGADLCEANLQEANCINVQLHNAKLTGAYLIGVNLKGVDLSGANVRGADLSEVDLSDTDLSNTNLIRANLSNAILKNALLSESNLSEAILNGANLSRAKLYDVDLSGANLSEANLNGIDLRNVNFANVIIAYSNFANLNLDQANNLESVRHDGPSPIGTDTINRSKGKIPEVFLNGCGLSPWEIEMCRLYNPDLTPNEISNIVSTDLFSKRTQKFPFHRGVFISYNHSDSKFVDKLRDYLMDSGVVTVWLDRHDMEAGDLQKQVHRQLRIQDILLIVLSKKSVVSDWVESELKLARKIEKEEGRDIICPVCLDDSWKDKMDDVLWGQLGKKLIVDFSAWKTKKFGEQFKKLLNGIMKNY